jgi:MFS family permease
MNSCNTAIQLSTPAHIRGRVIALYVVVFQGTTPLGAPIVGWTGSAFGARWSVLAGAIAGLLAAAVAAIVLARRPDIGRLFAASLAAESTPTAVGELVPAGRAENAARA